ncbi:hypothetical protein [Streptomyces sp. WMMB 714]|uniref:hypothetical protein n=1 Tax=Streptomyces sp. WMMB 714 TaxID=1286822 RepID=UPI00131B4C32|nr:hypothetical protein [Streptomyces sp. WMMB 714]
MSAASAAFQAIINGVSADAPGASLTTPSGLGGNSRRAVLRPVTRPRYRRPVLAVRQDA